MIHRLDRFRSFMISLKFRTKTTFAPSGEICGSVAVSRSNISMGRKRFAGSCVGFKGDSFEAGLEGGAAGSAAKMVRPRQLSVRMSTRRVALNAKESGIKCQVSEHPTH